MYPTTPSDAYDRFSNGPPPTAPPPQQQPTYNHAMNQSHHARPAAGLARWSTGLFHCMDDPGNCLITCLCPCITFGQIADIVDRGTCSCAGSGAAYAAICATTGMGCLYSCVYRTKMRAHYDLDEGECPDFLVHWCCELCALCQEYRELKNRGFDMGIGWDANMERRNRGVTGGQVMGAPATPVGMMR
ncbi:hypothetical protein CFC21_093826 [Triticum aestivum]|nr:cell number regulator 1 [Aegilops tauschii subsp. strangulata]XP_037455962.1 cell number regulator 1-like [Triticum dicoccoides]XP_044409752.1 cell number regulator 1-like [Triticum aestivum]XP_044416852.1 cell number regulator 1-like [Triticum aestivum]VAI61212.1 unnamed protein product [Triticum turgidum subsp. durum]KAF7086019.1 hypothetical protein CFC21_089380 [Triticum aestivum]KAF7091189.1 hypothetical protein CFC21_093826 [Triticum aestivum]